MTHPRSRVGRAATILVAALLGGLVTALLLPDRTHPEGFTAGRPESTQLPGEQSSELPQGTADRQQVVRTNEARSTAVPRTLVIPRLGLRMPVVAKGVDDTGAMALPASASVVAWYRFGSRPLDQGGATVLAGHVDTAAEGAGPLVGLAALRVGDLVEVRAGGHLVTYRTTSVTRISKALIDLPAVFSREGVPRLHLVTCGGPYLPDRGGYQDNVVVAARRLPAGR